MEKMTFALPRALKAAIIAAAAAEGRDPSSFIRFAMATRLGIPFPVKSIRRAKATPVRAPRANKEEGAKA